MSVDDLRKEAKDFARGPILEIEKFLMGVQEKVRDLELTENLRSEINFAYHRCWAFRQNLIERYYPTGEVFTDLEPHLYKEYRLSAVQEVKHLQKNNAEYRSSVIIPEILVKQSEEIINFLDKKHKELKNSEVMLHLEKDGTLWYLDRSENSCEIVGVLLKLLIALANKSGYLTSKELAEITGNNNTQLIRNGISELRTKIDLATGLKDVIESSEKAGEGYRINPKYIIRTKL